MTLIRPSLDYTNKDFDSLDARQRSLISAAFPDWTDENVSDFGNLLVNLFSFVGDTLGFYQDTQARETRWTQATQRKNLIALCKLIGYTPAGTTAASASVLFSLPSGMPGDVPLPKGTIVRTEEITTPISYQILTDTFLPAGQLSISIPMENSEFQTETFPSSNTANQEFQLSRSPFVDGSAIVSAADGVYTKVKNFLASSATDRHFVAIEDQAQKATVRFGNGINGTIPSGTIEVNYKTGGGAAGRVEANKLKVLPTQIRDVFGNPAAFTVTNIGPSSGGNDRQSNESIQLLAPEDARIGNRSISREDFEIAARKVANVGRALMLGMAEDADIQPNSGFLLLVPRGGGVAPQPMIDAVRAKIDTEYPTWKSFDLSVVSAPRKTVDVAMKAYRNSTYTPAQMAANIRVALSLFFRDSDDDETPNALIQFGWTMLNETGEAKLAWSDVFNACEDALGVAKLSPNDFLLNGIEDDVVVGLREFPTLGTVTIVDGVTGLVL